MAFLVLTGPPGSGKTETAKALSDYFGVQYCDVDRVIESNSRMSIPDIFAHHGENEFRRLEQAAADEAIRQFDGIVALGGGAVLSEKTRNALAGQCVVYLQVSVSEGLRRIAGQQGTRPLLDANSASEQREMLEKIYTERAPLYEQVSTITINTTNKPLRLIVAEISANYAAWQSAKN